MKGNRKKNQLVSRPFSIHFELTAAILITALMMYIAWTHNPQGEIHGNLGINWGYWFLLGGSWFLTVFTISFIISFPIFLFIKWIKRNSG